MIRVKICGITSAEDARVAIDAGADYLGLVFSESKRRVGLEQAENIVQAVPDFKNFVGVFVNEAKEVALGTAMKLGLHFLQLHGDEDQKYCSFFAEKGIKVIKAIRLRGKNEAGGLNKYQTPYFLLDTYSDKERGGTGRTFDWTLLDCAEVQKARDRIFVSGGLTADNIAELIERFSPFAVDVSSGVEKEPGKKDALLVQSFITKAKQS